MRKLVPLIALFVAFVPMGEALAETLTVFAAASLQSSMEIISQLYTSRNSGTEIISSFESSGTLKTQIEEGAECDVFISAALKQMNALEAEGLIDKSSRTNLLTNEIVLAATTNNSGIESFADLATDKLKLIALGNSDVPAGAYAQEILVNLGLWDKLNSEGKISFAGNVTEVAMQVLSGAVDCGIVYATDASVHGLKVIALSPAGSLKTQVVYPAAMLSSSQHKERARDFLKYLQGSEAQEIFASFGFSSAQ